VEGYLPVKIGRKKVSIDEPAFLVAEVGSNHNRDLTLARRLIEMAFQSGVDAVKFQLFQAEWLYPKNCGMVETAEGPVDFYEVLHHCALPRDWIPELKHYAQELGLTFLCTPFCEEEVDVLASLNVEAFKVASPELNHLPLLRKVAQCRKPIICSTGLSILGDIEEAIQAIRQEWPEAAVILLHCVTAYPLPPQESNLGVIPILQKAFGLPVGFSDHTIDPQVVPAVAVASGACMIEKHFTLNHGFPGPDHSFSLEPEELKSMVRIIREVEKIDPQDRKSWIGRRFGTEKIACILGHGRKEIMPAEAALYPNDKRSIHAIQDIHPEEILTPENIRILRSERNLKPGLHPRYWKTVLGRRTVQPIKTGDGVCWEHLLAR